MQQWMSVYPFGSEELGPELWDDVFWVFFWLVVAFLVCGYKEFNVSHLPHDIHAAVVCIGVWVAPELTISFSTAYFFVELVCNLIALDFVYIIHGGVMWYLTMKCQEPLMMEVGMYTALIVEFSTPFLHWWQRKEDDPVRFVLFYISFTLFRVVGAPYWWYGTVAPYHEIETGMRWAIGMLLSLQIVWFFCIGYKGWTLFFAKKRQQ